MVRAIDGSWIRKDSQISRGSVALSAAFTVSVSGDFGRLRLWLRLSKPSWGLNPGATYRLTVTLWNSRW